MPKINVYLPDELAGDVRALDLPVSAICQQALEEAVSQLKATKEERAKSILARFSDTARAAVARAEQEALELKHNRIGTEHLLLALLRTPALSTVLRAVETTRDEIRSAVAALIEPGTDAVEARPPFTPRAKQVLESAFREALRMGKNQVQAEHLLLGLARDEDGGAAKALAAAGVDYGRARAAVLAALGASRLEDLVLRPVGVKVSARRTTGSMAGLTSLVEMQMNELKSAISAQLDELRRERDAERARSLELWEKLRAHGIDPGEPSET